MPRTPMTVKPAQPHRASLAACLVAARADADRLYGDAAVPLWTPRSTRKGWAAGAAAVALLAGAGWWWAAAGDAPVGPPATLIATAPIARHDAVAAPGSAPAAVPAGATTAAPAAAAAVAEGLACDPAPCQRLPALTELPSSAADPDTWALHPEPGPVAALPRSEAAGNTPEIPDANDATPGDETSPDEAPGADPLLEQD